jgi:hypothetical protein
VGLLAPPASTQTQTYPPGGGGGGTTTTPPPTTPPPTTPPPRPGPPEPTCNVSDTTLDPGQQVTVSGNQWKPGSTVTITLQPEGIHLGSPTVGTNGTFSTVVTIPTTVQAGPHTIQCSGLDRRSDPVILATDVTISGTVGGGGSAFTGTVLNVPLWMLLIAALLAAGLVVIAIGRRRRRSVSTGS